MVNMKILTKISYICEAVLLALVIILGLLLCMVINALFTFPGFLVVSFFIAIMLI